MGFNVDPSQAFPGQKKKTKGSKKFNFSVEYILQVHHWTEYKERLTMSVNTKRPSIYVQSSVYFDTLSPATVVVVLEVLHDQKRNARFTACYTLRCGHIVVPR